MKAHVLIIVEASAYNSLPSENQGQFMGMIRRYLVDKTAIPMSGVSMQRGSDTVYVGAYWAEHVTAELTTEVIAGLNVQLTGIAKIVECDDIQAALLAEGITAIQGVEL